MNRENLPVEIVSAWTNVIIAGVFAFAASILIAIGIVHAVDGNFWPAFSSALAVCIIFRLLNAHFRRDTKLLYFWYNHRDVDIPDWAYESERQKSDMKFVNFFGNRRRGIPTKEEMDKIDAAFGIPTKEDSITTLKKDANKSILDD